MANTIRRVSLFVIPLLVVFSSYAFAGPVTDTVAENVGATFLAVQDSINRSAYERSRGDTQGYGGHSIISLRELRNAGTGVLLAYVFALEPKGFVVVSPDTEITPVIAYSFEGNFNWEESEHNGLLHMLRYDIHNRLEMIAVTPQDIKDRNYDLWVKYFFEDADFLKELTEGATYGPLLKTEWDQNPPYNNYCPMDPATNEKAIVGCVATAMAMIVNYHACTKSVTFTSADNYTTTKRGIAINASSASIPSITYASPQSDDMAAKISYACGVSVKMDYTSSLSLAYTNDVAGALKNKFGFTSATWKPSSEADFYTTLQNNMQNSKPAELEIRGVDDKGNEIGHAIVCDGYKSETGQYHLNFGWGATQPKPIADTWYALPGDLPINLFNGQQIYKTVTGAVLDITSSCTQPSCPDLYSWNGSSYDLAGPLFLGTHSPLSEWQQKRRVVAPVKPQGNELVFKIKEIDGEESYINSAAILYSFRWAPADKRWAPLPLISATHSRLGDVSGPLMAQDEARVHTVPGDEIVLRYWIPYPELGSSLFESGPYELEFMGWSTGYYLWQDETWCETWSLYPEVSVQPGDRVTLDAMVNNMTTKELPESAEVWFVLKDQGGSRIGPVSVSGLAPAMPMWVTYDWQVPEGLAAGVYTYAPRVYVGDTDVTWDDLKLKVPPKNASLMTASPAEASRCSN